MVLHGQQRLIRMSEALDRAVIQIDVREFQADGFQALRRDGETMILRGDFHSLGQQVLDRMIVSVMAEFQLDRLGAQRQRQELVSQADAEYGHAAGDFSQRRAHVINRLGVAGSVADEHAIGLECQYVLGCAGRRHNGHAATDVHQIAQYAALHAAVDRNHVLVDRRRSRAGGESAFKSARPFDRRLGRDSADQILPGHTRQGAGLFDQIRQPFVARGQDAVDRSVDSQHARQGSRVDAADARYAGLGQHFIQRALAAKVGSDRRNLPHDEALDIRAIRFVVFATHAVVPLKRIGHAHDLPAVGRIGHDLLISAVGGIENDLPRPRPIAAEGDSGENRSVGQCQPCRFPCLQSSSSCGMTGGSVRTVRPDRVRWEYSGKRECGQPAALSGFRRSRFLAVAAGKDVSGRGLTYRGRIDVDRRERGAYAAERAGRCRHRCDPRHTGPQRLGFRQVGVDLGLEAQPDLADSGSRLVDAQDAGDVRNGGCALGHFGVGGVDPRENDAIADAKPAPGGHQASSAAVGHIGHPCAQTSAVLRAGNPIRGGGGVSLVTPSLYAAVRLPHRPSS